jgi:hypothetical protein
METVEIIEKFVDGFLSDSVVSEGWRISEHDYPHVKNMCVSILCTKYKIGYPGGGFVQSIVNNNLFETFYRADSTNVKYIQLYVNLINRL